MPHDFDIGSVAIQPSFAEPPRCQRVDACELLERLPRDSREVGVDGATFFQFQRWFCQSNFATRQAAVSAAVALDVPSAIFDRSAGGARPNDWNAWRTNVCTARNAAQGFPDAEDQLAVKHTSVALTRCWSSCLNRDGTHAWFEIGEDPAKFVVAVRGAPSIQVRASATKPDNSKVDVCDGIPKTGIVVPAHGWTMSCERDPAHPIRVEVTTGTTTRTIELRASTAAQAPTKPKCISANDSRADIRQRLLDDKTKIECLQTVYSTVLAECQRSQYQNRTVCRKAQTFRHLTIAVPQLWQAKERCATARVCDDQNNAMYRFEADIKGLP